ncbi:MAG: hypothetical protein A2Y91_03130 [Chloroflexi bacterium RBG_13_54_8]|nr:MAG: hypothetical protein A2Y91_03130 [Chloroflexi bacterium RBG_13_54_8]
MNEMNGGIRVGGRPGPPNRLWAALFQASHAIQRARDQELAGIGISVIQSAVLWVVKGVDPPATPAKISKWLMRKPNSISGLLDRMEKQDLIRRLKDKRRNRTIVELTEKGNRIRKESVTDMKVLHDIASVLSEEELERTTEALVALRAKAIQILAAQQEADFNLPPGLR